MRLTPITDNDEVGAVIYILCEARKRPHSGDFLKRFPWTSIKWYMVELEDSDLENLFLFWDGTAWGESGQIPPRTLHYGVEDFRRIASDTLKPNHDHFVDILRCRDRYRAGESQTEEPFLILAGVDDRYPLLIIDGNHRAVAALWWARESGNRDQLPRTAWLALSPHMVEYPFYSRLLQSGAANNLRQEPTP